jgi:tRNA (guanine37-N1)-methyltransferase
LTDDLGDVEQLIADTTCLVARRDGRLVGSVFGRRQADASWFIGRLMVAPDLQGTGLGRRLLDLIEEAGPPGTPRSVLVTGARSAFNQAFYVRRGYRVVAEETHAAVPTVVMERVRS